jgi:3'(2'), 5'-bisphosphate nucleotidase
VVSRSRRPAVAEALAEHLSGSGGAELVPLGSAGAKAAAVLAGEADAYVHEGGFYEWDTAAPVAVARAAGFHASRLDGGPLRYNQESAWMPDILVCPSELAGTLLEAIRAVRDSDVHDSAPAIG